MKIYESVEAVPSRVLALLRLLEVCPPSGIAYSEAIELLQPRTIRANETADSLSVETIGAAVDAGLIEDIGPKRGTRILRLSPSLRATEGDDRPLDQRFYEAMCHQLLQASVGAKENRFARIVAWILLQSPGGMPQGHNGFKDAFNVQGMGCVEHAVQNDARWDNVIYWARYLGLVCQVRTGKCEGILPDPSIYIERHLRSIFANSGKIRISEFRERIGRLCPVLDGGAVHKEVAERINASGQISPLPKDRLTGALCFGLRFLKKRGTIDYESSDEARHFLRTDRDEKITLIWRREN